MSYALVVFRYFNSSVVGQASSGNTTIWFYQSDANRSCSTFVNPIGLANAGWKYLIMYCVWIAFEIVCIYFLWPETKGRTLEELTFLFEDKDLQDRQVIATEKQLFGGGATSVHETENKDGTEEKVEVVEPESKA